MVFFAQLPSHEPPSIIPAAAILKEKFSRQHLDTCTGNELNLISSQIENKPAGPPVVSFGFGQKQTSNKSNNMFNKLSTLGQNDQKLFKKGQKDN